MSALHTYTVHVTVLAKNDLQAWSTAYAIAGSDRVLVSVTDADDWAEHVTDRERVGTGRRVHHDCSMLGAYPIEDVHPFPLVSA